MKTTKIKAALLLGILLSAVNVHALTFPLDSAYVTPTVPPLGTSPWLEAKFEDIAPNSVRLTMAATGLSAGTTQSVGNWLFNFTDTPSLGLLQLQYASGDQASIFLAPNLRPAGGGRFFDIEFDFAAGQFAPGDQSVYLLSSIDPLQPISAESFNFVSFSASPQVNYYSASLVEGISGGQSSWIAAATAQTPGPGPGPAPIPEPATMLLLGTGLTGMAFFRQRKLLK